MSDVKLDPQSITLREAVPDDSRDIWSWWNDPVTRKMMRKNDPVPWEEHEAWFAGVLNDPNRILCVGEVGGRKFGVIRFDLRAEQEYEVSINFNPEFRGRGLAAAFMQRCIDYLQSHKEVAKLWAGCKAVNAPSKRTFERAGFVFRPNKAYNDIGELFCERVFSKG